MTSSYRRRDRSYYRSDTPTSVGIYWSQQYNAYAIKWMDTHHFQEMTPVISYFKSRPYGDCVYDPDNKVWYFKEEYLGTVRIMIDSFGPTIFEVNFVEKPVNNAGYKFGASNVKSVDSYFNQFFELTGEYLKDKEYPEAKKIYRRICMRMHPDIPGNDSSKLSSVNECWSMLEQLHYQTKKEPVYDTST